MSIAGYRGKLRRQAIALANPLPPPPIATRVEIINYEDFTGPLLPINTLGLLRINIGKPTQENPAGTQH